MYKKKIKILRIISTLNPKYGGPSKAIIDSSIVLAQKGFHVDILTCDRKNEVFFKSKKIKIINKGPSFFGTYWFNPKLFFWLKKNKDKYSSFIIHGIWQFKTLLARLLIKKKYYVFLHGQLDPFFETNFFKLIKKKLYWFLFEKKNLIDAKSILLTSKGEMQTLNKTFVDTNNIKKKIVKYGIIEPKFRKQDLKKNFYKKYQQLKNKDFFLFLGRFHEKKGCEIIIEAVKELGKNFNDLILMAGPLENNTYERKIINLIRTYNLDKNIIVSDAIFNDLKWGAIQESKAMLLPSHGENFGVSLVESMCFGKPVLTTNKVNISKEILKFKAGYISNDDVNSYKRIITKFNSLNKSKVNKMSQNAQLCFKKNFNLISDKDSLYNLIKKDMF